MIERYEALPRGSGNCEVVIAVRDGRPITCEEPAAICLHYASGPLRQCAMHYDFQQDPDEPQLKELRREQLGWKC